MPQRRVAQQLAELRARIDALDSQLIDVLAQRRDLVQEIGSLKSKAGLPVYARERESAMIMRRRVDAARIPSGPARPGSGGFGLVRSPGRRVATGEQFVARQRQ